MVVKKEYPEKNFDTEPWSDEEKQIVLNATSRKGSIADYKEKFPDSTRSDDAIGRRFYNVHPDKRKPVNVWSDEERQPILDADDVEGAIAGYRSLFPESTRTSGGIRREWYGLRPEKRGEAPIGRKKGGTNKAPLKGTMREKYMIPVSTKQDAKAYNHGVYICVKYGKPYTEALKCEAEDLEIKKQKKQKKVKVASNVPDTIKKTVSKSSVKKTPTAKPAPKPRTPVKAPNQITQPVPGFGMGQSVVHNGSKSSPFFGKVGKIVQILKTNTSNHLIIRFGKMSTIAISPEFIIPTSAQNVAASAGAQ